ncbi:MAG: copper amine oxidase N-terminal domain-containing protein [Clostridia bacterium]|nr:copper amine oxidase N-terminal domain-containing protein [Clostridia bacterium]
MWHKIPSFLKVSIARKSRKVHLFVKKIGEKKIEVLHGEGKTIELDVSPFIVNGATLIPLRGLLEEMGAEITWNGEDQSILVKSEKVNMEFTLQIANKLVYVKHPTYGDIRYTLLTTPEIKDNRTFIPLRFVSEILGYEVFWDGESQTIDITK